MIRVNNKKRRDSILKMFCYSLLIILNLSVCLHSQKQKIDFHHLSIEEGLSQSSVYCILHDNKGFMWFGTEAGLNRYDGYKFVSYLTDPNNPNSLSNSWIFSFLIDRSGTFWIGTEDGLNRYIREKEQFSSYRHDPKNPNSLSNNRILVICEDRSGIIWIGTDGGLNKLDPNKKQFTRYLNDSTNPNSLSHNSIRSIIEDQSGHLWIGTNGGGLDRFDPKKEQFIHYKNNPKDPRSLSDNYILSIIEDHSGDIWIGTEHGGLNQFNREKEQFIHFKNKPGNTNSLSDNHINVIFEDKKGVLWIGTNDGGLNQYDRKKRRFTHHKSDPDDPTSLGSNRILSIYEDNTGGLWIGNYAGGIHRYYGETQKFIHYQSEPKNPNSLSYNDIRQVYEDHIGILWIGTDGGGLNRFDRKNNRFKIYKKDPKNPYSLSDNRIFSIIEDHSNVLWIGSYGGGLNQYDRKRDRFIHFQNDPRNPNSLSDNRIRIICEDRSGMLWIGTDGGGLNRFDQKTGTFSHYFHDPGNPRSLIKNRIFCLNVDHSNVLWIGTFGGGLDQFDREKEQFIHYQNDPQDPGSLSNNYVLSIYEDQSNVLWIGTDGGLNKYDQSKGNFVRYTESDGLPNNVIYDILEDQNGNLWMCTNKGVSKFNPRTLTFKNYDTKDGLQSNEFNTGTAFKSKKGEMFFGGVNGFNSFFPDKIVDNPHVPKIVITDFQIFNQSVTIGKMVNDRSILENTIMETKEIELSYEDNVFSFEFAALHYISPEKNQYAYMMEGFEKDWNYVGNRRFVTYTGLPPGEYIFKVKGSNNDGVWNEKGISIIIKIIPPFWRTWWFYLLVALLIILSVFGGYRFRVRQLYRRREELENLVNKRTLQLEEANKELEKLSIVARETENAVLITDENGDFIWVNEGFSRMYEVTLEQLIKDRGKNIIDSSTSPEIKSIVNECIKYNKTITYESSYIKKSGEKNWTQTTLTPIFNKKGKLIHLVAIDSDISKIKGAEEELSDQRDKLEEVNRELEKLSIVARETENSVMIMDAEGNFEWVNEGFTRLYDATLEQFKTKIGTNIVHSSTNPDIANVIKKCKEEQKTINYESYTISKSGRKIWMQTTLTPIVNDSGTVTNLVVVESDITKIKETEEELSLKRDQLEEANKKLQRLATLDGLTGIANHRRFSEFYEMEWQRSIRSAKSISIILVDLDYFKLYNDTYGHQAGDECLRKIAQKLKKACRRPSDLAARYGGEEFILVLPETDVDGANIIAERLRGEIEALKIPHKESSVSPHVTISLGCATYIPIKNDDSSSLIKAADMALYESKQKGRNRLTTSDSF